MLLVLTCTSSSTFPCRLSLLRVFVKKSKQYESENGNRKVYSPYPKNTESVQPGLMPAQVSLSSEVHC